MKRILLILCLLLSVITGAIAQDMISTPLTFQAVEAGTITVNLDEGVTFDPIQYKLNSGEWTIVTWGTPIELAADDVISFRGDNGTCYATDEMTYWSGFHFESSNDCYVYGNMMSLIDQEGFATNTTLTETYTFFHLFQRSDYELNTAVLNHPTKDIVLPATTLTANCYDGLFDGCPGITRAPELPATTLASWCYCMMFSGTGITNAPALPATTLADNCYADMFMNCTSLTTAPDLPAATLVEGCYTDMFAGCTALNYVKCLATDMSAGACTMGWLNDVALDGTFVKAATADWSEKVPTDDGHGGLNINGIPEGWTVEDDPYTEPLTFEAINPAYIQFKTNGWSVSGLQYRKCPANSETWGTWSNASSSYYSLSAGEKLQFKKENNEPLANSADQYCSFQNLFGDCYVYGNVMSLFDFATAFKSDYACDKLFLGNTYLHNHKTKELILGATTLSSCCYSNMFKDCTNLTKAPALPATSLANSCYSNMFKGCTNLTKAPALPATSLANSCYWGMFDGCSGLTTAPELPATTLAPYCYNYMFQNCTSLTTAPELPAATLQECSYDYMFHGCTNLNYVKCFATDISAFNCTLGWLYGVATTGTFVKAAGMDDWTLDNPSGIPEGWTVLEDTPYIIPLTFEAVEPGTITIENPNTLTIEYNKNNSGWTSANTDPISISVAAGDVVEFRGDNASYWASGDSGETVTRFTASNPVYVYGNIMSLIDKDGFATNTTLTEDFALAYLFAAPSNDFYQFYALNSTIMNHPDKDLVLPATTLTETCYGYMFAGCEGLTRTPELPATTLAMGCYHQMFADCSGLTVAPSLPATTLAEMCYSSMFYNCTSLVTAPDLLAPTLVDGCYMGMFDGCSNLNFVRCLATSVYAEYCTTDWLNGVAAVGTFVKAFDMWSWSTGVNGIPVGWTVAEDLTTTPLTIEAIEDGTTVTITNTNSLYLRVSINNSGSTSGFNINQKTYTQTLQAGAVMSIKLHAQNGTNTYSSNFTVTASKDVYVYGNPLSLVFSSFSDKTDLTGCAYGVLEGLFCLGYEGETLNPHIKNHPTKDIVLPATTLSEGCYMAMFSGCTGLTRAPELPATILSEDCYHRMFEYSGLTQAPVLPAATLIGQCYGGMFDHCTNLNYVRCMATDLGENNGELACGDWLKDVAATGTFVKAPGMESWTVGPQEPGGLIYGIPEGWVTCDQIFQTAGDWNVAANWNTGTVPAAGSNVVIAANAIVPDEYVADAGSVFLETGNTLTIADGGQLKHNNAGVIATVKKNVTGYGETNVNTNLGYCLLASPITPSFDPETEGCGLKTANYDLYQWDMTQEQEWGNYKDNAFLLANGTGYLYASQTDTELSLSGALLPSNVDIEAAPAFASDYEFNGWNLYGNPFVCDAYLTNPTSELAFYRMNETGDGFVVASGAIAPMEGVFVQATANDQSFNFSRTQPTRTMPALNLAVREDNTRDAKVIDNAIVRFDEGNTLEKFCFREGGTKLFFPQNGKDYAVVNAEGVNEIPVNFKAEKNGEYTLTVSPSLNSKFLILNYLHLIDNLTGADIDLLPSLQAERSNPQVAYSFTAKTTDYAARFKLVFNKNENDNENDNEPFAYIYNGEIILTGVDACDASLQVIDMMGRVLLTRTVTPNSSLPTPNSPGVYVLRLINGDKVRAQKIVID